MATGKRAKTRELDPARLSTELAKLRAALEVEGAVKPNVLAPKQLREAVIERLVLEGYERTKSWIRRPLSRQLAEAFRHGATLSEASLRDHVRGATRGELNATLAEAEARGEVFRVVRGKSVALVGPSVSVLSRDGVERLRDAIDEFAQTLQRAAPKRAPRSSAKAKAPKKPLPSLLRTDVEEALARIQSVVAASRVEKLSLRAGPPPRGDGGEGLDAVVAAVGATRDARTGLSFIPKVVARLASRMSAEEAIEALLAAARADRIELRPEGGLGRLSAAEIQVCPPGPNGTRLSWARGREGEP